MVLGGNYSFTKQVNSIQQLLAFNLITGTEVDIGKIIYSDLVSPPHLVPKPKKGKSQIVTPTLPKSQGPEASEALSKKRNKPKSKKRLTETNVTPPKPTEGSEQSHSGTRKSKPLPEGTATHPQDSGGNKQPIVRDTTSTNPNEGMAKTMSRPEGSLGDKNSGENIPPVDMEPIHTPVDDPLRTDAKY
uniref:Uncharacterized protein n=1 Tax=Tanacetum cinerariifolium TaxID=118510 RepID=A0A699GYL9_TANCI|nr:hypothetical protein [Tanacetum cinerariifolium]